MPFEDRTKILPEMLERLTSSEVFRVGAVPPTIPQSGIYVFSENGEHIYVGRSDRIRRRISDHYARSWRKAALALKIARSETGRAASYRPEGSTTELMNEPAFSEAFDQARARIRQMDVQVVEILDPVDQALFEIYAAEELSTPFNQWGNT